MALSTDRDGFYLGHQTAQPMRTSRRARGVVGDGAMALTNFVGEYSITGLLNGRLEPFVGDREAPARAGYFRGDLRQMAELAPGMLRVTTKGYRQSLNPVADQPLVRIRRFGDEIVVSNQADPENHHPAWSRGRFDASRPWRSSFLRYQPVGNWLDELSLLPPRRSHHGTTG